MSPRARLAAVALMVLGGLAPRASATEVADGKLTLSGFGQWAYGRTTTENAAFVGNEEGNYENAQFALALTANPEERVVVAGQVFLAADGEVSLDWAFAEYRFHDLLHLRAGKVKNPLGIFMEVKDVGTLRPFFTLPQSVYGPANFAAESYLGAGLIGEWEASSRWGLGYDLYIGALALDAFEPTTALPLDPTDPASPLDFSSVAVEEEEARGVIGGRVVLTTPVDGLSFRVSGYTGQHTEEGREERTRVACYGLSAEYALDRLQLRGEVFRATEGDVESSLAGYAEVAWNFHPKLQAALRFEQLRQEKEGVPDSSPLLEHTEGALGLSWWPSPSLVVKASYHYIDGNRFALPALSRADGTVDRRTDLFVAGAQFSF
jgi:hypothetical protein